MKGLIGIPTAGDMPREFVACMMRLKVPEGTIVNYMSRATIHVARETLVMDMQKGGFDWLFMIDDDMTFPPDVLLRLLSLNVPVASAMCFKRVPPYTPCFYKRLEPTDRGIELEPFEFEERPTEPFAAEGAGAACMLIRREVFDKIQYPWFLPLPFAGEDICFCKRLKDAGIPLIIDPAPEIGHLETRAVGCAEYLEWKSRMEGAV